MVMEHSLDLMERNLRGNLRIGNIMGKEHTSILKGKSIQENTRMGNLTVKGHTLGLMEQSM